MKSEMQNLIKVLFAFHQTLLLLGDDALKRDASFIESNEVNFAEAFQSAFPNPNALKIKTTPQNGIIYIYDTFLQALCYRSETQLGDYSNSEIVILKNLLGDLFNLIVDPTQIQATILKLIDIRAQFTYQADDGQHSLLDDFWEAFNHVTNMTSLQDAILSFDQAVTVNTNGNLVVVMPKKQAEPLATESPFLQHSGTSKKLLTQAILETPDTNALESLLQTLDNLKTSQTEEYVGCFFQFCQKIHSFAALTPKDNMTELLQAVAERLQEIRSAAQSKPSITTTDIETRFENGEAPISKTEKITHITSIPGLEALQLVFQALKDKQADINTFFNNCKQLGAIEALTPQDTVSDLLELTTTRLGLLRFLSQPTHVDWQQQLLTLNNIVVNKFDFKTFDSEDPEAISIAASDLVTWLKDKPLQLENFLGLDPINNKETLVNKLKSQEFLNSLREIPQKEEDIKEPKKPRPSFN